MRCIFKVSWFLKSFEIELNISISNKQINDCCFTVKVEQIFVGWLILNIKMWGKMANGKIGESLLFIDVICKKNS